MRKSWARSPIEFSNGDERETYLCWYDLNSLSLSHKNQKLLLLHNLISYFFFALCLERIIDIEVHTFIEWFVDAYTIVQTLKWKKKEMVKRERERKMKFSSTLFWSINNRLVHNHFEVVDHFLDVFFYLLVDPIILGFLIRQPVVLQHNTDKNLLNNNHRNMNPK